MDWNLLDIMLADEANREDRIERERELYFDYQTADDQYNEYLKEYESRKM